MCGSESLYFIPTAFRVGALRAVAFSGAALISIATHSARLICATGNVLLFAPNVNAARSYPRRSRLGASIRFRFARSRRRKFAKAFLA